MGQSPPSSTYNFNGKGRPFFQGKADFGELYPSVRVWCNAPAARTAEKDDILLSVRAPVGSTNLAPTTCSIGRGLATVRPEDGVSLKFLLYAFRRFADDLDAQGTGTTFKAVSGRVVKSLSLPVPPAAEQVRIADRLDDVFSDLNAGIATLQRCREKLARYRASVLQAAVKGDLTADWREKNPDIEPASKLLQRILAERRRRWEQEQQRAYAEKGKAPPKNWKAKYREPVEPDAVGLPALPTHWQWVAFDQIGATQGGLQKSPARVPRNHHFPYLRVANVHRGALRLDELSRFELTPAELRKLRLEAGDVLLVEGNGSRKEIGRCALWHGEVEDCVHQNHIIRVRPVEGVVPEYVGAFLNSPIGQLAIQQAASSTSGLYTLSVQKVRGLAIALPPLAEQRAIADFVGGHDSAVEELGAALAEKGAHANGLRQAILHHAFAGNLLPQDPGDEPASRLLNRIAKERQHAGSKAAKAIADAARQRQWPVEPTPRSPSKGDVTTLVRPKIAGPRCPTTRC